MRMTTGLPPQAAGKVSFPGNAGRIEEPAGGFVNRAGAFNAGAGRWRRGKTGFPAVGVRLRRPAVGGGNRRGFTGEKPPRT